MSTGSAVGLSTDVRLLRTLKTVLPALNLNLIAPPSPVPGADEADPGEIRVVLLDADYPDTDALLKWLEPDRPIPAILMREDDGPLSRSLRGASAFLAKPVDPNKLRAAIELVVVDWEIPAERAPRPAPPSARAASIEAGPETEFDRVLGPALAEIGIPAGIDQTPRPRLPLPRIPAPQPLHPRPRTLPSAPGEGPRTSAPPPVVPERRGPVRDIPVPARSGVRPAAPPKETGTLFSSFDSPASSTGAGSMKRFLAVGLAVFMLAGAGYLVFGRKTARPPANPPAAASPAGEKRPASESSLLSGDPRAAEAAPDRANPVSAVKKDEESAVKSVADAAPKTARPAGEAPKKPAPAPIAAESEPGLKAAAAEPATAKVDPPVHPPAEAEKAAAETSEKSAPAAKPGPDKAVAEEKDTPEPAARPATAKTGDLIALNAVDIAPALLNSVDPIYPAQALRNKQAAKVTLRVLISEKGEILQAEAEPGGTDDPAFVNAAMKAVRRWSYSPAYKNGAAVRVWKSLIIDFRIR